MTKEQINNYSTRITQCNRTQLVVVIYDIIIDYLDEALEKIQKDDIEGFVFNIKKSRQFLNELSSNLDFHYSISVELMNIYMYVNENVIKSEIKKQNININVVRKVMDKLRTAFIEVSKQDTTAPLMLNSQKIYEGFTYGMNAKNNVSVMRGNYGDFI